jgi:hypothetical protein
MRTFSTATLVVLAAIGPTVVTLSSADATAGGNRAHVDQEGSFVVHDLCAFPVSIDAHVVGAQTEVETSDGSIVRVHLHETDIYSANGNSVEGSYTFEIQVTNDAEGNPVKGFQTGVIVRVPLPTGETFRVTGRADALNAQTDYISAPTHGVTRNLDALCAYLGS